MRILRGRSNLEVSSKGFAIFVLGLVLSTFLGGAVRTLLHSDRVHDRIVSELKNRFPKHEFQIGPTEVLLARGIWPALGLRLHNAVFKQDICGKLSFVLTLPEAVLPLDIFGLSRGRVHLGDVEINGGELHLDYRACPATGVTAIGTSGEGHGSEGASKASISPPKLEWEKLAQVINGVELRGFAITYEKNPTWKILVKSAYVGFSDEMNAQAAVELKKSLPFGELSHPVEFDLHSDKRVMQWNLKAGMKEGSVHLAGSLDVGTQATRASVDLRQVPIRDFMSEMFQMGFVEHDLKLKGTWLSCHLKWEGQLQNYSANPVQVRDCRLEGGYGRAEVAQADFWLNSPEYFKEAAKLKVMQLQLQPVLEALNRQVMPAVISHLGVWSGQLDFHSGSSWQLDGELENGEIVFANQSMHGKQIVEKVHTHASQRGNAILARIDDISLREGEFTGHLEGELNSDWRGGSFRVAIDKLSLAPSIQRLLVGGTVSPLSVQGQGTLVAGELSQWSGTFILPEVQGEGWSAQDLQWRTGFHAGSFTLDTTAKRAAVNGSWTFYPELRNVLHDPPAGLSWHDLVAHVEIQKTGGIVHSATATQEGGGVWRAKGSWVRDGEFNGSLTVPQGKRSPSFLVHGESGQLTVQ